jgi:hypothetical protein
MLGKAGKEGRQRDVGQQELKCVEVLALVFCSTVGQLEFTITCYNFMNNYKVPQMLHT